MEDRWDARSGFCRIHPVYARSSDRASIRSLCSFRLKKPRLCCRQLKYRSQNAGNTNSAIETFGRDTPIPLIEDLGEAVSAPNMRLYAVNR